RPTTPAVARSSPCSIPTHNPILATSAVLPLPGSHSRATTVCPHSTPTPHPMRNDRWSTQHDLISRPADDSTLMSRLRADDVSALDELMSLYWRQLVVYVHEIVG